MAREKKGTVVPQKERKLLRYFLVPALLAVLAGVFYKNFNGTLYPVYEEPNVFDIPEVRENAQKEPETVRPEPHVPLIHRLESVEGLSADEIRKRCMEGVVKDLGPLFQRSPDDCHKVRGDLFLYVA